MKRVTYVLACFLAGMGCDTSASDDAEPTIVEPTPLHLFCRKNDVHQLELRSDLAPVAEATDVIDLERPEDGSDITIRCAEPGHATIDIYSRTQSQPPQKVVIDVGIKVSDDDLDALGSQDERLFSCRTKAALKPPNDTVRIEYLIGQDGRVIHTETRDSTAPAEIVACMDRILRTVKFPAGRDEAMRIGKMRTHASWKF